MGEILRYAENNGDEIRHPKGVFDRRISWRKQRHVDLPGREYNEILQSFFKNKNLF